MFRDVQVHNISNVFEQVLVQVHRKCYKSCIGSIRKILQHINNAANQRWGSRDVAAAASWAVVQRQQTCAWTEHQWRSVEHAAVQQHACKEAHRKVVLPVASKGAGGQHLATNQVPWIVFLHNFLTKDKIIFS